MDYADLVTRLVLWKAACNSNGLSYNFRHYILKEIEEGDYKNSIRDLYHKIDELSNEIDNLLYKKRPGPGDLDELYILTDKHWEVILELYKAIGQEEFDYQMAYFQRCKHSRWYRETIKKPLNRFLNGILRD